MANPKGSRWVYFSRLEASEHDHLSKEEIHILLTKGKELFGLLSLTQDADEYLAGNGDLVEVITKW